MKVIESELSVGEFKALMLFEIYYQEMMCLLDDNENHIKDLINEIMDYHFSKAYGAEYNKHYMNIVNTEFNCICKYEEN